MRARRKGKWGREPNFTNVSFPGTPRLRWLHSNRHLNSSWRLGVKSMARPDQGDTVAPSGDLDGIDSLDSRGQGGQRTGGLQAMFTCTSFTSKTDLRHVSMEGHESLQRSIYSAPQQPSGAVDSQPLAAPRQLGCNLFLQPTFPSHAAAGA